MIDLPCFWYCRHTHTTQQVHSLSTCTSDIFISTCLIVEYWRLGVVHSYNLEFSIGLEIDFLFGNFQPLLISSIKEGRKKDWFHWYPCCSSTSTINFQRKVISKKIIRGMQVRLNLFLKNYYSLLLQEKGVLGDCLTNKPFIHPFLQMKHSTW